MSGPHLLRDVLAEDALLVTPEEAAALLRVGRTTVYGLMKAGDLRAVYIGRSCRLPRSELHRYIAGLTSTAADTTASSAHASTDVDAADVSVHTPPGAR